MSKDKPALIIEFEDDRENIIFTRERLEALLKCQEDERATEYRCKVCGVPMAESYSEGRYVNSALETDRWEKYHGIQAMNGYPMYCIVYNDTFGWQEHDPEEV